MPQNTNPWVTELLSWHGHDRGGVRVPFHATMGRPLGDVVETPLIEKIKKLAQDLMEGTAVTPRWIFLIGGPGNGKSEAVEAFICELDTLANGNGALAGVVARKFEANPVAPRRVDITGDEIAGSILHDRLRRMIIIQDASAVDEPEQIAEDALIEDLADLITCPPGEEPVFICCANRGLVARALSAIQGKEALDWLNVSQVTELLRQLLTATGLGPGALALDRPECWPLERDRRFAAWPLDLSSIITTDNGVSPFEQMVATAANKRKWEGDSYCGDCTSKQLCPFYANAETLRGESPRQTVVRLLRHGELATGQRWNFRDSFSLCAELIIGQRDDFNSDDGTVDSPCAWVHQRTDEILFGGQPSKSLSVAWELALHLYSQSLFPVWLDPIETLHPGTVKRSDLTQATMEIFSQRQRSQGAQVRLLLAGMFSQRLDPALATPPDTNSVLRQIEDEFGQSVRQGSETFKQRFNPLIDRLLELMAAAENDWIDAVREAGRARDILESLRILCSILVKRFIGVREGEYLNLEHLSKYESILQRPERLWDVVQPLRAVLAPDEMFGGSLIRVFGQPSPDIANDILVTHPLGGVVPRVSSESTDTRPGHDIPWLEVQEHRIPLTFDLFAALESHSSGAQIASFPPHTRAALDKVKNAIAGSSARDTAGMLGGGISIRVGTLGILTPGTDGTVAFQGSGTKR